MNTNNIEINIEMIKNMLGERDIMIELMKGKIQELEGRVLELSSKPVSDKSSKL